MKKLELTRRLAGDPLSPKSEVKGMTVYLTGMAEPSLVIDSCSFESNCHSVTDMGYILARSAHTIDSHVAANSTRENAPGGPGGPRGTMFRKGAALTSQSLFESWFFVSHTFSSLRTAD